MTGWQTGQDRHGTAQAAVLLCPVVFRPLASTLAACRVPAQLNPAPTRRRSGGCRFRGPCQGDFYIVAANKTFFHPFFLSKEEYFFLLLYYY